MNSSDSFIRESEETVSDAVAAILRSGLQGLDETTDPVELRRRLRQMIHESRNVRAYVDNLHQQVSANQEAIKALTQHRNGTPAKRVNWKPDAHTTVEPEIMAVFLQWGWTEEETRAKILGPEHTLEKAVYHLLRNYLKDGGAVPAPDKRVLVDRAESAQCLIQQLVTLQSSANGRNLKSRSEPLLVKPPPRAPDSSPDNMSEAATYPRSKETKKKGFSWARLFRWRFRGPSTAPFAGLRTIEARRATGPRTGEDGPKAEEDREAKGKERVSDSAAADTHGFLD